MAPSKPKSTHHPSTSHTTSSYDAPLYPHPEPPTRAPPRDNSSLNLSVLQRHNPQIRQILSIAPYAVIYTFSASAQTWEKSGVEGTLFVCQLEPSYDDDDDDDTAEGEEGVERYAVVVLNRRGLENFEGELKKAEHVEVTDEYVILQVPRDAADGDETEGQQAGRDTEGDMVIYGVWIFAEEPPSSTALMRTINTQVMQECAALAEASEARVEEGRRRRALQTAQTYGSQPGNGVPMGRQLSLRDMFNQQRQVDDGWSVQSHWQSPEPTNQGHVGLGMGPPPGPQGAQNQTALLDLFRQAKQDYQSNG